MCCYSSVRHIEYNVLNVIKHVLASLPRDWFLKDYIALFEASVSYNGHCDSKNAVGLLAYCNSCDNLKHFEKTV